jgi:AcrR family transcriptional regulator
MGVKNARPYDSSHRRAQAKRTREAILDAARQRFLAEGYSGTTVAAIARDAAVSVETIYKAYGGKPGLVRALWQRGLDGRGPIPAPERSDEMSATQTDPAEMIRHWGVLSTEVAPQVGPILLLVRTAAATDPAVAELLAETDRERWDRMRHNAARLAAAGGIREGVSLDEAADVMWTATSTEIYHLLVRQRQWPIDRYGQFVAETIAAALLP